MTERLGWVSPEIAIEDALQAGYAAMYAILDDDALIDALLKRAFWNASDARRTAYRSLLRQSRKIPIVENYPTEQATFPCHAILMRSGKSTEYVGDLGEEVEFEDGTIGSPSIERWDVAVGAMTFAEKADELRLYHTLAKFFLAARRLELSDTFEHGLELEENELGFAQQFLARHVYHRVVEVRGQVDQINAADIVPVDVDDVLLDREAQYAPGTAD